MNVEIIGEGNLAIYIPAPELGSCGLERDAERMADGLARLAKSEVQRVGLCADGLHLTAYPTADGLLLFVERNVPGPARAAFVFERLDDAASAAQSLARMPLASALTHCEGRWYVELADAPETLCILSAQLCEFGRISRAGGAWLREHGVCVCGSRAAELLCSLA